MVVVDDEVILGFLIKTNLVQQPERLWVQEDTGALIPNHRVRLLKHDIIDLRFRQSVCQVQTHWSSANNYSAKFGRD